VHPSMIGKQEGTKSKLREKIYDKITVIVGSRKINSEILLIFISKYF
tara:strand:+ start:855 stop:995 length:141 start_codon:yes stop_codon:yes gene_type:complete